MIDKKIAEHAIIVGGGMVGLMTARVLSDYFGKVTIIERDLIEDENIFNPRVGAPQGLHTHFLAVKGVEILKEFFPALEEKLLELGAHKVDFLNEAKWYVYNSWKPRFKSKKYTYTQTRALLEGCIRTFINQLMNVTFLYQHEVYGLLSDPKKRQINGVRIKNIKTHEEQNIYADFIVDASGRNTHFPEWLENLGFEKPIKTEVKIDIQYVSREFILPNNFAPDWKLMTIYREAPIRKKSGVLVPLNNTSQGRRCLVTLMGQHGDFPGTTDEEYLEFARQLESTEIYDTIKDAKPLTSCAPYKIPSAWRYDYSSAKNMPSGFIAIGDSSCTLNPIYAQGISTGARSVKILSQILAERSQNYLENIRNNYFKKNEKSIDDPWSITTCQDFIFPETKGKRPFGFALLNFYRNLVRRASPNPIVWEALVEVSNLERHPSSLFRPAVFFRALLKLFT